MGGANSSGCPGTGIGVKSVAGSATTGGIAVVKGTSRKDTLRVRSPKYAVKAARLAISTSALEDNASSKIRLTKSSLTEVGSP